MFTISAAPESTILPRSSPRVDNLSPCGPPFKPRLTKRPEGVRDGV